MGMNRSDGSDISCAGANGKMIIHDEVLDRKVVRRDSDRQGNYTPDRGARRCLSH